MRTVSSLLGSILLALLAAAAPAPAAAPESLEQRIFRSFSDGDWARAAALIEQYLEDRPNDAVMLYNAACAFARLGQRDTAARYLMRSVQAGLRDLEQVARDPDLESIRDHPTYRAVLERAEWSASREAEAVLERWRSVHQDPRYRYEKDDERRLVYATALEEQSHREMRRMLEQLADHLLATGLGAVPRSYVLIAVPTPEDARLFFETDQVGGVYEHSKRTLVARDTGASLRHEFFHALHYADMDRLGQLHPLWVQEGLASLYEDYVIGPAGNVVFLPNERHNVARGLSAAGRLTRWSDLFTMPDDRFMVRASQLYPQVRSIFEFLADRGKLGEWYLALSETFLRDATGALAFESCFGMELADVEREWRVWLRSRPVLDTTVDPGDASLGIVADPDGGNDGVVVARILPGSAAEGRLAPGDTIVAVDGTATRSLAELQALIASKRVGETVRIRARRDSGYFSVAVRLRPLRPVNW